MVYWILDALRANGRFAMGYWVMGIGEEFFFGGGDDLLGGDVAEDKKYHALGAIVRFHPIEGDIRGFGYATKSLLRTKYRHG